MDFGILNSAVKLIIKGKNAVDEVDEDFGNAEDLCQEVLDMWDSVETLVKKCESQRVHPDLRQRLVDLQAEMEPLSTKCKQILKLKARPNANLQIILRFQGQKLKRTIKEVKQRLSSLVEAFQLEESVASGMNQYEQTALLRDLNQTVAEVLQELRTNRTENKGQESSTLSQVKGDFHDPERRHSDRKPRKRTSDPTLRVASHVNGKITPVIPPPRPASMHADPGQSKPHPSPWPWHAHASARWYPPSIALTPASPSYTAVADPWQSGYMQLFPLLQGPIHALSPPPVILPYPHAPSIIFSSSSSSYSESYQAEGGTIVHKIERGAVGGGSGHTKDAPKKQGPARRARSSSVAPEKRPCSQVEGVNKKPAPGADTSKESGSKDKESDKAPQRRRAEQAAEASSKTERKPSGPAAPKPQAGVKNSKGTKAKRVSETSGKEQAKADTKLRTKGERQEYPTDDRKHGSGQAAAENEHNTSIAAGNPKTDKSGTESASEPTQGKTASRTRDSIPQASKSVRKKPAGDKSDTGAPRIEEKRTNKTETRQKE